MLEALLIGCLAMVFILVITEGVKRQEEAECQQWQRDSKIYAGWYSTDNQKQQCLSYSIKLE